MESSDLDDPVKKAKLVRVLTILTPFAFVLCWVLAWLQGAEPRIGLIISLAGTGMCLGAAGVIHIMGSKSWMALVALKIAVLLAGKR